jgi:hypothetical protein
MSRNFLHHDRRFGNWPLMVSGAVTLAILVSPLCIRAPRAYAQGPIRQPAIPVVPVDALDKSGSGSNDKYGVPKATSTPPPDPALVRVKEINGLIDQKQQFLDATTASIDVRREVIVQCQQNIDALTKGVSQEGLDDLSYRIDKTRPRIDGLKRVIAANRDKIALAYEMADNLNRRIIQLQMQVVYELRPQISHLLRLTKQLDTGVNKILCAIDRDDPRPDMELERVAKLRAELQPSIEAAEAAVLNRAADQGEAAAALEDREYERQQQLEANDQIAQ